MGTVIISGLNGTVFLYKRAGWLARISSYKLLLPQNIFWASCPESHSLPLSFRHDQLLLGLNYPSDWVVEGRKLEGDFFFFQECRKPCIFFKCGKLYLLCNHSCAFCPGFSNKLYIIISRDAVFFCCQITFQSSLFSSLAC